MTKTTCSFILSWYEHPFSNPSYAPAVSLFSACFVYNVDFSMNTSKSRRPIFSHFDRLYLLYKNILYGEEARCILFFFRSVFSARPNEEILSEHDKPSLSASVTNQNAVFVLSCPFKFQSLPRQELVSLTRDQALLLFFFPLFFLERGRGGGKKCEKCLTRDMTAKQVRVRPRASITHSYKTRLQQKIIRQKLYCLFGEDYSTMVSISEEIYTEK